MMIEKFVPSVILKFIKLYLSVLLLFMLFRIVLFFTETSRITHADKLMDICYAFLMGLRFDIVISSYILALPFLILTIFSFFKRIKILNTIISVYLITFFSLAFLVCAIDIPYFNQFFARFSITAFEWFDNPSFVAKMIIQEPRYWLTAIPLIGIIFVFFKLQKRILNSESDDRKIHLTLRIALPLLGLGFIFLGIRGRYEEKSPIKIGTAYFCNNSFLNQLGLNPNFTLIRSYLDSKKAENKSINLMDEKEAIKQVQHYLKITHPN